jgi:DNA-binding Lrp family transcriptional regulator
MTTGFVLVSTAPGSEHRVYNRMRVVDKVQELHPLFGEYDIIAKVEADDLDDLGKLVIEQVKSIPGVIDTRVLAGIGLKPN